MKNAVVLLNVVFLHSQTTRASTQRTPTTNIMRIRHSQFGIRTMQHLTVFFTSSAQVWGKEWTSLFLPESKIRNMTWFCMTFCKSGSEMSTVSTCLLVGWDGWETSHRLTTSKGSCTMLVTAETSSTSTNVLIEKKKRPVYFYQNIQQYFGILWHHQRLRRLYSKLWRISKSPDANAPGSQWQQGSPSSTPLLRPS